jgi:Base plate wedge protein 53
MSTTPFDQSSRYYPVPLATFASPDGRQISYVLRRLIPQPETLYPIRNYIVNGSDRVDNIAASQYGDPTQFWQLCDANAVFDPADLTASPGRSLVVAMPQGVPGTPHV